MSEKLSSPRRSTSIVYGIPDVYTNTHMYVTTINAKETMNLKGAWGHIWEAVEEGKGEDQ